MLCPRAPIVVTANSPDAVDILELAGSTKVIQLADIMGQALARRIGILRDIGVLQQLGRVPLPLE